MSQVENVTSDGNQAQHSDNDIRSDYAVSETSGFDSELDSHREAITSLGEYINKTAKSVYQRRKELAALREKLSRLRATLRCLRAQRQRVYTYAQHWKEIPGDWTKENYDWDGELCSSAATVSFNARRAKGISLPRCVLALTIMDNILTHY
jgi:hypothetical protein